MLGANGRDTHDPIQHHGRNLARIHLERFCNFGGRILGSIVRGAFTRDVLLIQPDHIPEHDRAIVGVIAGDPSHLHRDQHIVADLHVAPAALVRQERRIGPIQKLLTIFGGLDSQTDPELHVGPHLIGDYPGRSLGRQHQGDTEGTAQAGDAFELIAIVGVGRDHLGELVHDDEKMRESFGQRIVRSEARNYLLSVLDQILGSALGEQPAAFVHDGLNRDKHSLNRVRL